MTALLRAQFTHAIATDAPSMNVSRFPVERELLEGLPANPRDLDIYCQRVNGTRAKDIAAVYLLSAPRVTAIVQRVARLVDRLMAHQKEVS